MLFALIYYAKTAIDIGTFSLVFHRRSENWEERLKPEQHAYIFT
jgi:hypothetical protein